MSGNLAPSKSTVYLSNLPFSLTNNDLHKILTEHGKIVRVTVLKDKDERKSKGVAFVLFLDRADARQCALKLNNTQLFGRTIKASIARDNGRAAEFIRRREYPNKSRCYECGELGHLSYKCTKNSLGEREPPVKKKRTYNKSDGNSSSTTRIHHPHRSHDLDQRHKNDKESEQEEEQDDEGEDQELDSWSAAVTYQADFATESNNSGNERVSKRRIRQASYFSDEEELEED